MTRRKSDRKSVDQSSRRNFLKAAVAAPVAGSLASGPLILHAADKAGSKLPVLGTGAFAYEAIHNWGELPTTVKWAETHGVCVDAAGLIYITHRCKTPEPMDAIVVFDPEGKCVRSFGKEYHGGGHGIDVRKEGNEEFLYLCDVKNRTVTKTSLTGEHVWQMSYPKEPNVYVDVSQFNPTNVAFGPDGGFYVADGYGSSYIHQYDKDAKWIRTWGGVGTEPGKMRTPHGLWLDNRPGREPSLIVADRANARMQYFTLNGEHIGYVGDMAFPAAIDLMGDVLVVPDLHARVTLLDKDNKVISHLGFDAKWTEQVLANEFAMRGKPNEWPAGKFVHPHDACFDKDGNLFITEWVLTGRVTKLKKVS